MSASVQERYCLQRRSFGFWSLRKKRGVSAMDEHWGPLTHRHITLYSTCNMKRSIHIALSLTPAQYTYVLQSSMNISLPLTLAQYTHVIQSSIHISLSLTPAQYTYVLQHSIHVALSLTPAQYTCHAKFYTYSAPTNPSAVHVCFLTLYQLMPETWCEDAYI